MLLFLYTIIAIFVCVGAIILQIFIEKNDKSICCKEQEPDFEAIVVTALIIGAFWIITLPLVIGAIIILLIHGVLISLCEYLYNTLEKKGDK